MPVQWKPAVVNKQALVQSVAFFHNSLGKPTSESDAFWILMMHNMMGWQ